MAQHGGQNRRKAGRSEPATIEAAEAGSRDAPGETPFYIPAMGPAARPRRALKSNDTFAVFDSHGDIGAAAGGPDGLFDHDTRFLSHLELLVNGSQPLLLGSTIKDDNLHLYVDLTNPDIYRDDQLALPKDSLHISRTIFLHDGALRERIMVHNHSGTGVDLVLALMFDSDFADIFEVRGMRRQRRGRASRRVVGPGEIVMAYEGLDGRLRETALCVEPPPTTLKPTSATFRLRLEPHARRSIFVSVSCRGPIRQSTVPFFRSLVTTHRERVAQTHDLPTVATTNGVLNEVLCRSRADLDMLMTTTPEGRFPYAGIPWYSTTFGRDSLITAMQVLWCDPSVAKSVLLRLARHQADRMDPASDAEPGKIVHEMRGGEMSALGEVPFACYYGSVDATPLFVMLAGLYLERTGDLGLVRAIWPNVERALAWMSSRSATDEDGFLRYARATEKGLANQGWKDSHDAVFHADGQLAEGPVALVEVQAYCFAARRMAAVCARALGLEERAAALEIEADVLRERFEDRFWSEELGLYVLGLDGGGRRLEVRTSNAGHALFAGIASPERARRVAEAFSTPAFASGWGIRTVAAEAARYNPMSYHNGSVWPHDNAMIAAGYALYGMQAHVAPVLEGLSAAAGYMDLRRLPELFCGFRRKRGRGPVLYPVACAPQAWASGAPFMIIGAMLGLEFDPAAQKIRLRNPMVPPLADEITVRGLRLGQAEADFAVRCDGESVSLRVLRTTGRILVTLVLDGQPARDRMRA